jgi:hypothetical protein
MGRRHQFLRPLVVVGLGFYQQRRLDAQGQPGCINILIRNPQLAVYFPQPLKKIVSRFPPSHRDTHLDA